MLVNIIHPYTYKIEGDTPKIGPINKFKSRDSKVSNFVKIALENGAKILNHESWDYKRDGFDRLLTKIALETDPLFEILFDDRVDCITTMANGLPIVDERPEELEEHIWDYLKSFYISHSELKDKIENMKTIMFIGGYLENCLAKVSLYFHRNYRSNGQRILYVPEVCVSIDKEKFKEVKQKLEDAEIEEISYDEAIDLLYER